MEMRITVVLLLCLCILSAQTQSLTSSEEFMSDACELVRESNVLRVMVRENVLQVRKIGFLEQKLNALESAFKTQTEVIQKLRIRLEQMENEVKDHMGTEFVLAYPLSYRSSQYIHLYIVSTEMSFSGNITSPLSSVNQNFSTTSGMVNLTLPLTIELLEGVSNKVIHLHTTKPVSVFSIYRDDCCIGEGFYVFPKDHLGTNYIAVSTDPLRHTYLAIMATSNDTQVTINLNTTGTVTHSGRTYSNNDTLVISVNETQAVQFLSDKDISGTTVTSNKPIAVMSGTDCTVNIGTSCNQLVEYLLPTIRCDTRYIVPPMAATQKIIKIISTIEGTDVTVTGRSYIYKKSVSVASALNLSLSVQDVFLISADYPVCVHMIAVVDGSNHSRPMMTQLPSLYQYTNDVVVPRPTIQTFSNYLSLVTQASSVANMRINNKTISNVLRQNIIADNVDYVSFWVALENGTSTYHVYSVSPYDSFGAIVYGSKKDEAYGYPAGISYLRF